MSLPEKMYEDLKGVMKHIIIGGIIVFLLWCIFVTVAMNTYWEHGRHFRSILVVIFGLAPFPLASGFVAAFFRYRELRWGRLIAALVSVLITVLLGLPAMEMAGY